MRTVIFGAALAFFLAQCATVTRGPMQRIRVGSKPTGASVKLSDCGAGSTDSAKTPAIVFVNRRATNCTLTLTLPEYGSRTVSLFRTGRALNRTGPPEELGEVAVVAGEVLGGLPSDADPVSTSIVAVVAVPLVAGVVIGGTLWGAGRGVDVITGANYQQNRSIVLIDFNKPVPKVAGRYSLVGVNGMELPTKTWTTRKGECQVWTNSGSVVLEETGRWSSVMNEQQFCGEKKRAPVESTAHGVFSVDGNRILLESEAGAASAVFQGDLLDVKMVGAGGQTAKYTLRLQQ